ncbi:MAG: UDP-N-acetylglucosamine 2-epimerase (non-hydrolyzing) [Propionibacteriales bacterium]|nr:UDP-N-acetylglucosamine 2-epimerase (non-hydrolyzing) [Propionibacteriales bacterium]
MTATPPLIMTVYGTRPEAVKMAPLVRALIADPDLALNVSVTGQHREMLDQVNRLFGITPDTDLDLLRHGQSLNQLAASALLGLDPVLAERPPAMVVVQGDTSTAAMGALAAFHRQVPVVHVEAGLRSYDLTSPYPEEGNRRLIGQLAALHLPPTPSARDSLLAEGVPAERIKVTGNTVIDALLHVVDQPIRWSDPRVAELVAGPRKLIVATAHRRESWQGGLADVAAALAILARRDDVAIVFPMHRNPIVREAVAAHLQSSEQVLLTEPMDYAEFAHLLAAAHLVLTDSGGVQEEAPSLGRPVLVTRETTERPEAVRAGAALLVGTDTHRIVTEVTRLLDDPTAHQQMGRVINPYGDGHAAARSVAAIKAQLGLGERLPDFVPAPPQTSHRD